MVADYNGWADLPEAEREALDMLELDDEGSVESSSPDIRVHGVGEEPASLEGGGLCTAPALKAA